MSNYEFRLPDIGEGIAEAEIVAWYVQPGDMVEEDAPLADMMTDKATVEMTAPVSGRVVALAGAVGDQIAIGAVLATFEVEGQVAASPDPVAAPEAAPVVPPAPPPSPEPVVSVPPAQKPDSATPPQAEPQAADGHADARVLASPAVRHRALSLGIDLAQVRCEGDRVRHADLDAFLLYNNGGGYGPAGAARPDEQVKVMGLRRRIAENMAASKRHIPHFTYVEEFDVTALEDLRKQLNDGRGGKPRLTILPLLLTAFCKALPAYPMLNARYDEEAGVVTRYGAIHLGIATQTDAGLMVPVVRNAQSLNVWQLSAEIARLAEAARSGKAKSDELSGSTITITSLGLLGGIATTPVINRPEVAILGPNKVVERPVFMGRDVVPAKLMNLSISCDHRVVDGWDAASFVQEVKRLVESPALLFAS